VQMEWPLQRRLSLAIDNDGSELAPTLEELLSIMLERAMSATRATGAAIALSEGRQMVCVAAQGTAPDVGTRLDLQVGFSGMCARKSRILLCDDAEMDPRVDLAACRQLGTRSMIAVPLLNRMKTLGILEVLSSSPHAFDDNDIRQLNFVAGMTVEALAETRSVQKRRIVAV
jgi:GAF domain-containing protein